MKKESYEKFEMEILEFAENKIYMDASDLGGGDLDGSDNGIDGEEGDNF